MSGTQAPAADPARLRPNLSPVDAVAIVAGVVIGVGIFETPWLVAINSGSATAFVLLWFAGGVISLVGALCYAELSTAFPNVGGEYHFLARAYGRSVSFLFAWSRITIIQTGVIASIGFVFGNYATQLWSLGPYSASVYAALSVVVLTGINLVGLRQGGLTQKILEIGTVGGILFTIAAGLLLAPSSPPPVAASTGGGVTVAGAAMIFVLLTYGGWNEAAYLSAELRDVRRNMVRVLVISLGLVTVLYVLLCFAYLNVLGLDGVRQSKAAAADLLRLTLGPAGAVVISLVVAASALSTLNGTVLTGGRSGYAAARDFRVFSWLRSWDEGGSTPVRALLAQGAISLLLVLLGTWTKDGFKTLVEYTSPVFWFFFLLAGLSLFVLRWREPEIARPFRVPLYPITPIIFCAACAYMLYSSLVYTGIGALVGVAVLIAGVPLLFLSGGAESPSAGRRGA